MFTLLIENRFKYESYPGPHHNIEFMFKDDLTRDRDVSFRDIYMEMIGKYIHKLIDNTVHVFDTHYDIFSSGILDHDESELSVYIIGWIYPTINESFDLDTTYILASSKEEALKVMNMWLRKKGIYDINPNDITVIGRYYQP